MVFYYNTQSPDFRNNFRSQYINLGCGCKNPIFLCIGTDKIIGDSLGPQIGSILYKKGFCVYGKIGNTVNATNLADCVNEIYKTYDRPYIIAIDACLGKREHIGYVTMEKGKLQAGAGVNKRLVPVGDIAITGIVSEYGQNGYNRLYNVPKEKIEYMAEKMSAALC